MSVPIIFTTRRFKKSPLKKCNVKGCRNFSARRPDGRSRGGQCHKHRCASWRANQPLRDAFIRLKYHAKARGIPFTITFRDFEGFAKCTDLINRMGPWGHSMTVDRIDNLKGYEPGNLQPLSRSKNSEKQARHDQIRMEKGYAWRN